ncbi:hypothetical protein HU200_017832 [Digitaria exilis]|uniref:Uncharacterized protein n=1 Tax=Digitaria exilis TaxID=1010633 RepID=A0A835F5A5_9POAL|nr:hypothetical protein HU200_017832 [Digitaria exilis]
MIRPKSKKLKSGVSRAASQSAVLVPAGASATATDVGPVVGAAGVVGSVRAAPEAGGAPGAGGPSTHGAPAAGGAPTVGAHATGPWWQAAALGASFPVHPSPGSSEWYVSFPVHCPKVPFVNYPNGSQLPENFHFFGGPMNYSTTPSPSGSPDAGAAQVGLQVTETIDVADDDTIQPTNSNGRSNASATSIDPTDARSDRRLNWSNEEDIRLAKEERKGKRKKPEAIVAIGEKLDKFMEATTKAEKIAQVQQNLADKKLEVAKEQTKSKMLDLYKELLCAPTSELSEEAKAERSKALELMASAIFSKDN